MKVPEKMLFLGLMSGTSVDGIDVGLLETDGQSITRIGPTRTTALPELLRDQVRAVFGREGAPADLVRQLTVHHAEAASAFLDDHSLSPQDIRAVGFHGQTIWHRPDRGITVQVGDGELLARMLDIDVVDQFRRDDVLRGGQGAPLAPIYHAALLRRGTLPAAIVNIGGLSNISWTDGERLVAFDSGIGNARLDDWMLTAGGVAFDAGGASGLRGHIDEEKVANALAHPYYSKLPPKSLDREELLVHGLDGMSLDDGAATLAAITADAIAASVRFLPAPPKMWIIAGGGRLNEAIMRRLRSKLSQKVVVSETEGLDGDGLEAHLMAYLAARFVAGLPSTFPETTGVAEPTVCGVLRSRMS